MAPVDRDAAWSGAIRAAALLLLSLLTSSARVVAGDAMPTPSVSFSRDVRPILSTACFTCHGPDRKSRKARLRLDTEEGLRRVFPGEQADAGQPDARTGREASEAWLRIVSDDEDERMPPLESHLSLRPEDIETIGVWIDEGAVWEGHWAFVAPVRPELPRSAFDDRARTPIDHFVFADLERRGLAPSVDAEREVLLRRIHLDLTGLPPTLEEIDAFLADDRESAYERAVDRLLASPHFGERMAIGWLDAARYGDSSVFHADGPRDMWGWRDWVIRAFNRNQPYDRFIVEQLAGDLLPGSPLEARIATGFLRNNASTDEGGAIAEEFRVEYAVDRVKTTSLVFLALSMECAQCHDHKYDPITQEEYYRFFAYFNQAADPGMQTRNGNQSPVADLPDFLAQARVPAIEDSLARVEARVLARRTEILDGFDTWREGLAANPERRRIEPSMLSSHLVLDEKKGDFADRVSGHEPARADGKVERVEGRDADAGGAIRLDGKGSLDGGARGEFDIDESASFGAWVLPEGRGGMAILSRMDDSDGYRGWDLGLVDGRAYVHLVHRWEGDAIKVLTKDQPLDDASTATGGAWHHVFATYDGSGTAAGVRIFVDGVACETQVEKDSLRGSIRTIRPFRVGRRNPGEAFHGRIDEARFYSRELRPAEVRVLAGRDGLADLLVRLDDSSQTDEVRDAAGEELREVFLANADETLRDLDRERVRLRGEIARSRRPISTVMVMQDVASLRPTFVLDRGDYASPREDQPVTMGTPGVLPPLPEGAPSSRLGLAEWLVRDDHPLTARVAVNRLWSQVFGLGLVPTIEDFGAQGERPSHPALLDWLAVDFRESGWDLKRALRQIVLSTTYRQSSRVSPALARDDPTNRWLARGPRFRLEGELIRDAALAASGLLVPTIGGPSVKPYQPPGLWNEVSLSGNVRFVQDHGEGLWRRSLYTYWKRSAPPPSLTIFDAPTREKCSLARSRTNTPLQALVTLNDPQFVEAARVLAERAFREGSSVRERILPMYRRVVGRHPTEPVLQILEEAHAENLARFRSDPDRADAFLSIGEAPRDAALDAVEHAALAVIASLILNLDEALTRG